MNKIILFELLFLFVLVITLQMGVMNLARAGQALIGIAVLNLVLGLLTAFGWPVLRGDISDFSPITRQDLSETLHERTDFDIDHPARSIPVVLFTSSAIALAVGLVLIYMAP